MSAHVPLHRHRAPHKEVVRRHGAHWRDTFARRATVLGLLSFAAAVIVVFDAIAYATSAASNTVTDVVLSNTPVLDVDVFFVYGTLLLLVFITLLLFANPKEAPFVLFTLSVFYFIRAFFISLTHIAPYPIAFAPSFGETVTKMMFNGGDLFFSGHVGVSFLFALIYWRIAGLRFAFLGWAIFFSFVVLLGHLHYSIDVAAAFFITYAIYDLTKWLFPRSYALFLKELPHTV